MNTVQRIAKNTGVLLVSQIVGYLFSFFFVMYTARYLGSEGFGILSFAIAFTGIFGVFADLGLSTLTVREVARDKTLASKYLGNIVVIKVILVVITYGLIALTINLLGYPEDTITVVYLIALSVVFGSFTGVFNSIFQAYEQMEYQSFGTILNSTLMLSGALLAIRQGFSIVEFASIYFLVSAVALGYGFVIAILKFTKLKIEVDWSFWRPTIKEALPFGLAGLFLVIFYKIDTVMLSIMVNMEAVGWYNAAYSLVIALLVIPTAFNSAIFPVMSGFFISSHDYLKIVYEKFLKYMIVISIPIGVGTTLLAGRIILLIFDSQYQNSIIILQILIWSDVLLFLSSPLSRLIESTNRQIFLPKVAGVCMLVNVCLNLLLIPTFSYIGATIATVITQFISLAYQYSIVTKEGYKIMNHFILGTILKVAIASLLMGIFVWCFKSLHLGILVIFSALIYFIAIYILRVVEETDIKMIKQLINAG
jgi:O-antigen/teichoic acid export membrane protein